MANADELVDFKNGGDSGEDDSASIQPVTNSEFAVEGTFRRPSENLRVRDEVLRTEVEDLKYRADYARDTILRCTGLFTLTKVMTSPDRYSLIPSDPLFVLPALSPGMQSGGRAKGARLFVAGIPYVGTAPDELQIVASSQYTGQRGYADGDSLDDPDVLSVGANGITIELDPQAVTGGPLSISAAVTGTPRRHIKITYGTSGTPTTAAQLVAWINADSSSQGTWGLRHMIRATTTTGSGAFSTALSPTKLQGGYDAELYEVTPAQFTDFFLSSLNLLQEGETLGIAFPAGPVDTSGSSGGRRQSIVDLPTDRVGGNVQNITPAMGNKLCNMGREPEKIPYAVPIGKLFAGEFIFIDGTRIDVSVPVALGESIATLGRFASTSAPTGASNIGYGGSGTWHPDQVASPTALPAGPVETALDMVPGHLSLDAPNQSGARRIGAEAVSGTVSTGNRPLNLAQGSIRQQLASLANGVPSTTLGGGVNRRVNEDGHELKGKNPVHKDFVGLTDGGRRVGAMLRRSQNLAGTRLGPVDYADLVLQPMEGTGVFTVQEPVGAGASPDLLKLVAGDIATRFPNIWPLFPYYAVDAIDDALDSELVPAIFVKLEGVISPDNSENGIYIFERFTSDAGPTLGTFQVRKIDITVSPNFSAITDWTNAKVTFLSGMFTGSTNSLTRMMIHQMPGKYTAVTIAVPGEESPWLEILGARSGAPFTGGSGAQAERLAIFSGNRAVWDPDEATPRETENILGSGDKALLDGVETGTAVDATAGHHHGGTYTQVLQYNQAAPATFATSLVDNPNFTELAIADGDYVTGPTYMGYVVTGYIVEIAIMPQTTSAANAGDPFTFRIATSAGSVFDATAGLNLDVENYADYKPIGSGTGSVHKWVKQMFVRCDSSGRVSFKRLAASATVDGTNSRMTVTFRAVYRRPA